MTNGGRLGKVGRVQGFLSRIYTEFGIFFFFVFTYVVTLGESCSVEWRLKCKGVRLHGGLEDYLEIWRIDGLLYRDEA